MIIYDKNGQPYDADLEDGDKYRELERKYNHLRELLNKARSALDYNLLAAWGQEDLEIEIHEALK